ncbi:hypothetical protein HYH02_012510 [Chlamydomonas schloesseri]|uniref:Uncharacterized protein n=1 Tax=Chlamydomonas schloesseri TaxID=2026947 RepID=A0A835T0L0_9CHLO|nr:hypothetical protein HYH02_012510 [Chlamydomonas schloesseri]|eukprot:KAG2433578.1 hypothetical protein HYH02_012510 [Chlamydomonas schloesseri]
MVECRPKYDATLDWDSGFVARGAKGCTWAKPGAFKPPPTCRPPRREVSRAEAARLGPKFSPILYQHPKDTSWLTDPGKWYREARIYQVVTWRDMKTFTVPNKTGFTREEFIMGQELIATRLFHVEYNETTGESRHIVVNNTELHRLAIIDPVVDGKLTGNVYFTMFRPHDISTAQLIPHAYVYTYHYFYPWNGCSNQALVTSVDGRRQGIEYYMCPDGIHEGDLEHIKVYVCEDDLIDLLAPNATADPAAAIRRTQYSQHGWLPDYDCDAGECTFQRDPAGTRRLVSYAGLFSHANNHEESPLFVYEKIRATSIVNMDGLYISDRFKAGPVFWPNDTNTRWLPFMSEMSEEQLAGEFAWAAFPGTWGGTLTSLSGRTITCFFNNFTVEAPCNITNPAYWILDLVLRPAGGSMDDIIWGAKSGGNTVSGPLWRRVFSFNWEKERQAPLFVESIAGGLLDKNDGLCPFEGPTLIRKGTGAFHSTNLAEFIGGVVGLVLASSVVAFAMVLPMLLVRNDEEVLRQLEEQATEQILQLQAIAKPAAGEDALAMPPATAPGGHGPRPGAVAEGAEAPPAAGPDAAALPPPPPPPQLAVGVVSAGKPHTPPSPAAPMRSDASASYSVWIQSSYLEISHQFVMRAFHASVLHRYSLAVWIFVGLGCYICGIVLGAIGAADVATALNRLAPLELWKVLSHAITVVFIIFGIVHLAVVFASVAIRPCTGDLLQRYCSWCTCCGCGSDSNGGSGVGKGEGGGKAEQPKKKRETSRRRCCQCCAPNGVDRTRQSWTAHALLAGLLSIEMNVTMLLFALGFMTWLARIGIEEACYFALSTIFDLASFLTDICLDLSIIGINRTVCGNSLNTLCAIWSDLSPDYLVYGSLLLLIAQNMFLVLATTNYVGMRTGAAITAAMDLADRTTREAERASRRLRQQQAAAAGGGTSGSGSKGPGWSKLFKRRTDSATPTGGAGGNNGNGGSGGGAPVSPAAVGVSDGGSSGVSGADGGK